MTVDAVPARLEPGGTEDGTGAAEDPQPRLQRQEALGPDAWPGFTPAAAREP